MQQKAKKLTLELTVMLEYGLHIYAALGKQFSKHCKKTSDSEQYHARNAKSH